MNIWLIRGALFLVGGSAGAAAVVISDSEWTRFDESFKRIGASYGVDWQWLKAFALNESDLGRDSRVASGDTSSDGLSWGLMQVTLTTGRKFDSTINIDKLSQLDPADYSIDLASQLIAQNKTAFSESDPAYLEKVVKSYNQGVANTRNEFNGIYTSWNDPNGNNAVGEYWNRWQRNYAKVQNG